MTILPAHSLAPEKYAACGSLKEVLCVLLPAFPGHQISEEDFDYLECKQASVNTVRSSLQTFTMERALCDGLISVVMVVLYAEDLIKWQVLTIAIGTACLASWWIDTAFSNRL